MAYKVFISPEDRAGNVYAGTALWNGKTTNEKEQFAWFLGSVLFLLAMLVAATVLSRRFVKPINESLAAVRGDTTEVVTSGISEIDELLTMIRERPVGALPPDVEARLRGFTERANTLTGTERTILQYYMDGYTVKDIPELARISASTVKTHNRNLYRKLGVVQIAKERREAKIKGERSPKNPQKECVN